MGESNSKPRSRKEIAPAFVITMAATVGLYAIMTLVQPYLMNNHLLPDFLTLLSGCAEGNIGAYAYWFLEDLAESNFIASAPAAVGLVIGGFVSAYLERKGSRFTGWGVDGNSHVFTAMFFTSAIGVIIGIAVFGNLWPGYAGWIPTFVVILIVQPLIIFFGAGLAKLATALVLSTFTSFPMAYLLMTHFTNPLGFTPFLAISITVTVLIPILTAICKRLPWMKREERPKPSPEPPLSDAKPNRWFIHRMLADIAELPVYGSELAAAGLIIGTIVAWIMNPLEPSFGAGNVPLLVSCQLAVAALAIFIYYPRWRREGWAFTFPGIVLTSAIIGRYCATGTYSDVVIAVLTVIVSAVVFVPLVSAVQKLTRYKGGSHVIGTVQASIFPVVIIWSLIITNLIIPALP